MSSLESPSESLRKIFLFGPQVTTLDAAAVRQLSLELRKAHNEWILQISAELPSVWRTATESLPSFNCLDGERLLSQLHGALQTGYLWDLPTTLPNTLLSTFTVITQLAQYLTFLVSAGHDFVDVDSKLTASGATGATAASAPALEDDEAWGLCIGTLSAFAAACSSKYGEFQSYGAAAIRLALLVGAVVDADNIKTLAEGESGSISVSWSSANNAATVDRLLLNYPKAYISVRVDERRLTITASKSSLPELTHTLRATGFHVTDVKLAGRFHWSGHESVMKDLLDFCEVNAQFQLPDASALVIDSRSEIHVQRLSSGSLHGISLRDILIHQSNWIDRFRDLYSRQPTTAKITVLCFGSERCVPPSVAKRLQSSLAYVSDVGAGPSPPPAIHSSLYSQRGSIDLHDDSIAVVGMSCRTAGANDLDEYWGVLCSGQSQHTEIPRARFDMETPWRQPDAGRKYFGNFIQGYSQFDHKFFKKSPREAISMDPQQRLALQAAYQAVEQSGYFSTSHKSKHIGCYTAISIVDYERNVACYPANAYTAKGNIKSFAAGNISHYFGWTGPSMTLDTACSASGVAVHLACRAILGGECTAALAGGVNVCAGPDWFYNLSGASFLSPTGQCKPFDTAADGYCRGEGVGFVYLKKLSQAQADGDQIYGIIPGTRVYQNQNSTAITVPNSPSLSELFQDVIQQAGIEPRAISFVEAHGTGTPVGDPAEYDAIRKAIGGPSRSDILHLSSVKGSIGHCEVASGIMSLVKVLLMILKRSITPQASFKSISPALKASDEDKIEIPLHMQPWKVDFRAALINNYGASGSNASMIVTQPLETPHSITSSPLPLVRSYPFWFAALDSRSLRAYVAKFRQVLRRKCDSPEKPGIRDVSFGLSRQSNRSLPQSLFLTASSLSELHDRLSEFEKGDPEEQSLAQTSTRPVILCFGGQVSTFVGLEKTFYDEIAIFRTYLDRCNASCLSTGLNSIYPTIFQRSPISKLADLHCALFSMQYSCAMAWIECGVQVTAVVGHSFGELSALCVAGVLSLHDTLKLIRDRASIIERYWGNETGSMMAIEASAADVETLLEVAREVTGNPEDPSIACYNGPRSFTLAGSVRAIDAVEELIQSEGGTSKYRAKKLNVTNAYHSALVSPLTATLEQLGHNFTFNEPTIRIERATEHRSNSFGTDFIANHLRKPVFFSHAVQRLAQDFPSAVWLEAGSSSGVTTMVNRALEHSSSAHLQPMNLTTTDSIDHLVSATVKLWKAGINVAFWEHHKMQAGRYAPILLPSYQFAETEHWIQIQKPPMPPDTEQPSLTETSLGLTTFVEYRDSSKQSVRFRVNVSAQEFQQQIDAFPSVQTFRLVPSMAQLNIVFHGLTSLRPELRNGNFSPEMRKVTYHNAFIPGSTEETFLDATSSDKEGLNWQWEILTNWQGEKNPLVFSSGTVTFKSRSDPDSQEELDSLQRIVNRKRCTNLLNDPDADEVLQGQSIYRAYDSVIKWGPPYRKLRKIAAKEMETAGRVEHTQPDGSDIDFVLSECFCQVASIHINLMIDTGDSFDGGAFICTNIGRWIRSPKVTSSASQTKHWDVFLTHQRISTSSYISDIFAFNPDDGSLAEVILGIVHQHRDFDPPRKTLPPSVSFKAPEHLNFDTTSQASITPPALSQVANATESAITEDRLSIPNGKATPAVRTAPSDDVSDKTREILCNLSGLEPSEIQETSDLVELGIDSLMAMEVIREVEAAFHCTLSNDRLAEIVEFRELVAYIGETLGHTNGNAKADTHLSLPETKVNHDFNQVRSSVNTNGVNGKSGKLAQDAPMTVPGLTDRGTGSNGIFKPNGQLINGSGGGNQPLSAGKALPHELTLLEVFGEIKWKTDDFVKSGQLDKYLDKVAPRSTELCIVYILDAFEQLGSPIRTAVPGQRIQRVSCLPKHKRQLDLLYGLLDQEARLIDINGAEMTRTAVSPPMKSADVLLAELLRDEPVHAADHRLTAILGRKLADCLTGKMEGVQLMFTEGRELLAHVYGGSPFMGVWISILEDFFRKLVEKIPNNGEPLCILEVGAGTGGTTNRLLPILAALDRPVRYTMTDLSGSLVAASRKKLKHVGFMEFKVLNVETEPDAELLQSQHIILSTNCIHATRRLSVSLGNIHRMLRPDGFLVLLELTQRVPWVDFIFGLVEGWWLFEDERTHALSSVKEWESVLHSVGYGHVDWTDGNSDEVNIQRLMIAHKSIARRDRAPKPPSLPQPTPPVSSLSMNVAQRRATMDAYIQKYTEGFDMPQMPVESKSTGTSSSERCVLVTGATGNLGAHLVAHLASSADVSMVVCLNRLSSTDATLRQHQSLKQKGIELDADSLAKLKIIATDTSKPKLGLESEAYNFLARNVTHIVHSAWPMSLTRPIRGYEIQFKILRNLIDLACEAAKHRPKIGFQFVSSIATVANYPLFTGKAAVPEELVTEMEIVPAGGYPEAKVTCEHILNQTLHRFPDRFDVTIARVAQISGSTTCGYWNATEYIPLMVKSSQVLRVLPDVDGTLSWCPVDQVAAVLGDLLSLSSSSSSSSANRKRLVYHIDNPSRQPWKHVIEVLARTLGISQEGIIPYKQWVNRVRRFRSSINDNPALQLIGFWDGHFIPMSCGDLVLDVAKTVEQSNTLRTMKPIGDDLLVRYIASWKEVGFLYE